MAALPPTDSQLAGQHQVGAATEIADGGAQTSAPSTAAQCPPCPVCNAGGTSAEASGSGAPHPSVIKCIFAERIIILYKNYKLKFLNFWISIKICKIRFGLGYKFVYDFVLGMRLSVILLSVLILLKMLLKCCTYFQITHGKTISRNLNFWKRFFLEMDVFKW